MVCMPCGKVADSPPAGSLCEAFYGRPAKEEATAAICRRYTMSLRSCFIQEFLLFNSFRTQQCATPGGYRVLRDSVGYRPLRLCAGWAGGSITKVCFACIDTRYMSPSTKKFYEASVPRRCADDRELRVHLLSAPIPATSAGINVFVDSLIRCVGTRRFPRELRTCRLCSVKAAYVRG